MASVAQSDVDEGQAGADKSSGPRAHPSYSGRLLLRMPRALHAELAQRAEREGTSLNQLIIGTLTTALGGGDGGGADADPTPAADDLVTSEQRTRRDPRLLTFALALNLVVIVAAGAIAVALLVAAWRGGL